MSLPSLPSLLRPLFGLSAAAAAAVLPAFSFAPAASAFTTQQQPPTVETRPDAVPVSPTEQEARDSYQQGISLVRRGELGRAVDAFTRAIVLKPDFTPAYFARAVAYGQRGDAQDAPRALTDLDRVVRDLPDSADARMARAVQYARLRRHDEAVADLTRYIALRPRDPLGYLNRATSYHAQKKFDEAIADYDRAIRLMEEEKKSRRPDGFSA
jgi:Flp pilus assembly protein TadD